MYVLLQAYIFQVQLPINAVGNASLFSLPEDAEHIPLPKDGCIKDFKIVD